MSGVQSHAHLLIQHNPRWTAVHSPVARVLVRRLSIARYDRDCELATGMTVSIFVYIFI